MHHANTFLDMVTSPNKISHPTASSLSHTSHPFDQGASPRVPFHNLQLFTSATRLHFENTARCGKKRGKNKKKVGHVFGYRRVTFEESSIGWRRTHVSQIASHLGNRDRNIAESKRVGVNGHR